MLTTMGPRNGPAGTVWIDERNIGTVLSLSMCQSRIPASSSARSKVKEQPRANATESAPHMSRMSSVELSYTPSR